MELIWHSSRLDQLSASDVLEMMAARQQVFVLEQQCLYPDIDELDRSALHLLARDERHDLLAYARINAPGDRYSEPSFGRVLTTAAVRGKGVGRELVKRCITVCEQHYPTQTVRISAQTYLREFYQSFGFVGIGEAYDEDGIEHIDMLLSAAGNLS